MKAVDHGRRATWGETLGTPFHDPAFPRASLREPGAGTRGRVGRDVRPPARRTGPAGEWARQDSNLRPRDYESPGSCPPRPKKWPLAERVECHFGYLPRGGGLAPDPPRVRGVPPRRVHGATWAPVSRAAARRGPRLPPAPRSPHGPRGARPRTGPLDHRRSQPGSPPCHRLPLPPPRGLLPAGPGPSLEPVEISNATCRMS